MQKFVQILIEKIDVLWFDATTTYFETFSREGYKKPGYSKDGKFKEDQIVIGMATDENGIPLHYKIFQEMLLIQILSYHLCLKLQIFMKLTV